MEHRLLWETRQIDLVVTFFTSHLKLLVHIFAYNYMYLKFTLVLGRIHMIEALSTLLNRSITFDHVNGNTVTGYRY